MSKWRIRESEHGFVAEKGNEIESGIEAGYTPGVYMPAFVVSDSARFDTRKQAEDYIARQI